MLHSRHIPIHEKVACFQLSNGDNSGQKILAKGRVRKFRYLRGGKREIKRRSLNLDIKG
jgi:hypothetical protein